MLTWEMIKYLSESNKLFAEEFFICNRDSDSPIICFLRKDVGSLEFRLFNNYDDSYISDNIIIYPTDKWTKISKKEADKYLKGNYGLL